MTCPDCQAATETKGLWRRYNSLQCTFCAARLIQVLGRLNMPQGETPTTWRAKITARRKIVMADSVAAGLADADIRTLVKGPMAVEGMSDGNKTKDKK